VAWKRTFLPLLGEMLVAPLVIPWTPATVMDPHHDYRPQEAQEEARLNDQEAWSRWLLYGCVISGDTAVRKEFKTKSRATSLLSWLNCQPLLQYTSDGILIAKAYKCITLHLTAPTGAIVNALNSFATALQGEAKSKGAPYHFDKHIRFVTAWYIAVADINVTSDRVRKMRKNLRSDPTCVGKSVPLLENFHTGDVWKALLKYENTELRAVLDDCGSMQSANGVPILTEYAAEQLLLFSRRMFAWATRNYNCARSSNAAGLRLSGSFQPTTKRGTALELADCGIVALGSVTFFDTKTYKNQWSPSHIVNAPRSMYIGSGPYIAQQYSYWYRLQRYISISAAHRAEMPPGEEDNLLIGARKCGRQTTRRKNHVTGKMDVHVPSCGDKCNKYHPLTSDAIASRCQVVPAARRCKHQVRRTLCSRLCGDVDYSQCKTEQSVWSRRSSAACKARLSTTAVRRMHGG
jgi:hypothetical protein